MLQSGMRRFLLPFLFLLSTSLGSQAQTVVAHGLIVQLKPGAQTAFSRELPSAAQAKRESLAHERMAAVAQGAGVKGFAHRQLTGDHRLMRFAKPLQGADLEDTMRRLRLHPDVGSVEPNVRVPLAQIPNDTNFALQWHLGSRTGAASALNMSSTWAITTGTAAVTVAVLDTGVLRNHPDLQAMGSRLLNGYDFVQDVDNANDGDGRDADASDPGDWVTALEANSATFPLCARADSSWHGTFIAGQIAAATNNADGIAGLNWNANLLPVRVSGKCGALLSDILDGMRWAAGLTVEGVPNNANPAKVINLSFGGDQACTASYQTVIDELATVGTLVVVAAGNGRGAESRQLRRPADCRGVMAVGAVQRDGAKTAYSFVGSNMALMASGGHEISTNNPANTTTLLLSTDNAGLTVPTAHTYDYKQGTSFSAPLAAGVASLMLAINPSLTPDALIARMKSTALPHTSSGVYASCSVNNTVACNCTTALCGAGLLNPLAAVQDANKPAAVIAAVGSPGLGATITLDGRSSAAVGTPTLASYAWSQISGTSVSIPNANASVTQVILPSTAGALVFQLTVTDTLGQQGQAQIFVNLEAPAATVVAGSSSGGGGADRWMLGMLTLLLIVVFLGQILGKNRR
jgi:serine protease